MSWGLKISCQEKIFCKKDASRIKIEGKIHLFSKLSSRLFDDKIVLYLDTADQALSCGARSQVRGKGFPRPLRFSRRHFQIELDSNLGDLQDVIDVFDIPFHFHPVTIFRSGNLSFGQEPGQRSRHSGCRG